METEKISIQLMMSERNPEIRKTVLWIKRKKWKKLPHWNRIPNHWKCRIKFNQTMEERPALIIVESILAGIEEKGISGNKSLKVRIFPGAATHDMYDYLKPLLKSNSDNINFHVETNNWDETSRCILNEILSLKNLCLTCKVIVSNLIYRSDNV